MANINYSMTIKAEPSTVFDYMDNAEHAHKWLGGLVEIVPLTEGGNRVGAQTRQVYDEDGQRIEVIEETLVYEPNRRVKIQIKNDMMDVTADYVLTKINGGTRIDYTSMLSVKGWMRLLSPFIKRASCKKLEEDFARLKLLVESA